MTRRRTAKSRPTARRNDAARPKAGARKKRLTKPPRGALPGDVFPCDDDIVGRKVSGNDYSGTVLGCAVPPSGKRGRHVVVGTLARTSTVRSTARARERRIFARTHGAGTLDTPRVRPLGYGAGSADPRRETHRPVRAGLSATVSAGAFRDVIDALHRSVKQSLGVPRELEATIGVTLRSGMVPGFGPALTIGLLAADHKTNAFETIVALSISDKSEVGVGEEVVGLSALAKSLTGVTGLAGRDVAVLDGRRLRIGGKTLPMGRASSEPTLGTEGLAPVAFLPLETLRLASLTLREAAEHYQRGRVMRLSVQDESMRVEAFGSSAAVDVVAPAQRVTAPFAGQLSTLVVSLADRLSTRYGTGSPVTLLAGRGWAGLRSAGWPAFMVASTETAALTGLSLDEALPSNEGEIYSLTIPYRDALRFVSGLKTQSERLTLTFSPRTGLEITPSGGGKALSARFGSEDQAIGNGFKEVLGALNFRDVVRAVLWGPEREVSRLRITFAPTGTVTSQAVVFSGLPTARGLVMPFRHDAPPPVRRTKTRANGRGRRTRRRRS